MAAQALLVVLEDHRRRIDRIDRVVEKKVPGLETAFFTTAPALISWFRRNGENVSILSLDHDLDEGNPPGANYGSGSEVVEFLSQQPRRPPVIVHSANQFDGDRMQFNLKAENFPVRRVTPFDDLEWISWQWLPKLQRLIRKFSIGAGDSEP